MKKYSISDEVKAKRCICMRCEDCLTDEEWQSLGEVFTKFDKMYFSLIIPVNAPQQIYIQYPRSYKYVKVKIERITKEVIDLILGIKDKLDAMQEGETILCRAAGYEGYKRFKKINGGFTSYWNSSNRYDNDDNDVIQYERLDEVIVHIWRYGTAEKLSDIVSWL